MSRNIRINEKNSIEDVLKGKVSRKKIVKVEGEVQKNSNKCPIFPELHSIKLDRLQSIKEQYRQIIDEGINIVSKITKENDAKKIIFYENQLKTNYEKLDILDKKESYELNRIQEQIFDNLNSIRYYHERLESYLNHIEKQE